MDFSDAVVVDTACIRTILAMRQEAVRKNQSLRFMSSNKSFLELLELLNKSPLGEALAD
jgi:anti-anti-sigma regulatory factor